MPGKFITIYTSYDMMKVQLLKGALESEGIKVVVNQEAIGGLIPAASLVTDGIQLAVHESDVSFAREVIQAWQDESPLPDSEEL